MITGLREAHRGVSFCYYLDVPFEETMRRHATKPQAAEYGFAEMSDWYRPLDLLPDGAEQIIPAEMSLDDTVRKMMADADLHGPAEPLNHPGLRRPSGRPTGRPAQSGRHDLTGNP